MIWKLTKDGRTLLAESVAHDDRGEPERVEYRAENEVTRQWVAWETWVEWAEEAKA